MRQISWRWIGLLLVVLLALASAAYAQGTLELIPGRSTVDNGGGTLSSGNLTLTGAIGQPDAGFPLRNGEFVLVGGMFSSGSPVADPPTPVGGHTELVSARTLLWPRIASLVSAVGMGVVAITLAFRKRRKCTD
jgi:hypothetical protein